MNNGNGTIIGDDFRRMQLLELDMLVELDRVCRKHDIKYAIMCGTLLGGIRHKGFIPWDDDVDVSMLREEYEKLRAVADELNPEICFFQDHDTDPEYRWGYGKLRRTGTTYIRPGQKKLKCKTGLYIDILPCDDIPVSVAGQMINDCYCFFLRKILWAEIGKDTDKSAFMRGVYRILSHINPEWVFRRLRHMTSRSNNYTSNPVRTYLLPSGGKEIEIYSSDRNKVNLKYGMPKSWLLDLIEIDFEGYRFWGPREYDAYLNSRYGDYMKLPPEDKRIGKAPAEEWEF